jgi:hypothetical protein
MDYLNKFTGGDKDANTQQQGQQQQGSASGQNQGGGFLGGLGDKFNSAAGGGRESEKNEDMVDKGRCLLSLPSPIMMASLTSHRCRLRPGEIPRTRSSGQRSKQTNNPTQDHES